MADRESCVAALKNVLNETEGIKFVTREFKGIDELAVTQFPAIIIEDDGEEDITYKTGDFADISFGVSIIGYIRSMEDPSTKLNELDKLTKKALGVDFLDSSGFMMTAGLSGFSILPLVERIGSAIAPLALFERTVQLTYESRLSEGL